MAESATCPSCGASVSGRFCAGCGAALSGASCAECTKPLTAGARFCHHCGAATGVLTRASPAIEARAVAWLVPGVAGLALVAFVIGQRIGTGSSGSAAEGGRPLSASGAAPFAEGTGNAGVGRAPDISQMSPEERATRLFDRVMRYGAEGKQDSARVFAPMAIQAYEMLGPPDVHNRYDIGMIAVVSGDTVIARAQADTILAQNPTHLLGLVLGIKSASLRNDAATRTAFQKRLGAAVPAERAKQLKEYADHKPDIDAALMQARGSKP
jgi:Double zinc ribbon